MGERHDFTDSEPDVRGMRRSEDGWDDGRRDRGNDGGWQAGPVGGAYGGDGNANGYNGQGYGRPEHPGHAASPGYAGQSYGGPAAGDVTRIDRAVRDSGYGGGYSGDDYQQQPNFRPAPRPPGEFPGEASAPARTPTPRTPRPYGRLAIFTLLDDRTAEFDRLAEEAAEGVRTSEPDTLVYVIHVVPKAPMQRIIYEIYRDRAAFENHESQPHIQRFTEARKSCVLATNIIDLRLKYAKVAALFQGDEAGRPMDADDDPGVPGGDVARPQPPRPARRALEAGPAAGAGYAGGPQAGGQYGSGQYGGGQYNGDQYAGSGPRAGQDPVQPEPGRYGVPHAANGQYNGADQYGGTGQYNGAAQYNGAGQYGGAGGYNGAGQYGGAGQYNGAGGYNGAARYSDGGGQYGGGGQGQGYGDGAGHGGYAAPPGPDSAPKSTGRPPWEEEPEWPPSSYPGQRYGG